MTVVIDPIEVVVKYVKTLAINTTVGGRIVGGQAPYGKAGGWTIGDTGITIQPQPGGEPERVAVINQRIAVRFWAATGAAAMALYLAFHAQAARTGRQIVVVTGANALLHALYEDSAPSLVWDDTMGAWSAIVFYMAIVAEEEA